VFRTRRQAQMESGNRTIPGASSQSEGPKTKAQKKNEKRKEKRKDKKEPEVKDRWDASDGEEEAKKGTERGDGSAEVTTEPPTAAEADKSASELAERLAKVHV